MDNREPNETVPEEEPQVFGVKKGLSGWQFNRRHFLAAAGAGAAAAAAGALAGCGGEPEPIVVQVTATPSPEPLPSSTLASPGDQGSSATEAPPPSTEAPPTATAAPDQPAPTQAPADTAAPPTSTVAPSDTPVPEQPRAEFAKDVTVPDGTEMRPGQAFTKTWRYRNSGNVPWGDGVRLVFVPGPVNGQQSHKLDGPDSVSVANVQPGDAVDVSVNLVAPNSPGRYRSYWRLQLADGQWLENNHYVEIVVRPPATNTPRATATQVPTAPPACGCDGDCGCHGDCGCDNVSHYWHPN